MKSVSRLIAILAAALLCAPSHAQGVVQQLGPVTAGHAATWWQNGQLMDGGVVPPSTINNVATTTGGTTSLQGGNWTTLRANAIQTNAYMAGGPGAGGGVFVYNPTCTPNSVTCVQDAGGNRWQLAQGGPVSVLQAGAYGDGTHDDTAAIQRGINLFTSQGIGTASGTLSFDTQTCRQFKISAPLVYAGSNSQGVIFKGCQSEARGTGAGTSLVWTGRGDPAMFVAYAANQTIFDGINFNPGSVPAGLVTDLWLVADTTVTTTTTSPITAGANVAFTVASNSHMAIGRLIGVGKGSANFETTLITGISGNTITATFRNNHSSGEVVGSSGGSSGTQVTNATLIVPVNAHSTLSTGSSAGAGVTITPVSMAGIEVGKPIFIGNVLSAGPNETVYPITVGGSSFTANATYAHSSGDDVVSAGSAVLVGNVASGSTDQVSETVIRNDVIEGYLPTSGLTYACLRYIESGNVKNHWISNISPTGCRYSFAFEDSSGSVTIRDSAGSSLYADVLAGGTASFNIFGLEMEDVGARLIEGKNSPGANAGAIVVQGAVWEGSVASDDYLIHGYFGSLTLIGNQFSNTRTGSSIPKIQDASFFQTSGIVPASVTSIGNYYQHATNLTAIFYDGNNNPYNYSQYPINLGKQPSLVSVGDYGSGGNLQYMAGSLAVMGSGPTIDGLAAGIAYPNVAKVGGTYTPITVPYTALQTGGTTNNLSILGLPAKTKVVSAYVDVTTPFTGTAGTLQLRLGTSSGATDLIGAFDAKSATVTKGLLSADLGTCLATTIQNGCLPNWASNSNIFLGAVSGSGNLSGLTAGSATVWIETEALR